MMNKLKNKNGGFLELIIIIILAIFLLNYFHLSVDGVLNWFRVAFNNIFAQ
jgi:hypothetical protein